MSSCHFQSISFRYTYLLLRVLISGEQNPGKTGLKGCVCLCTTKLFTYKRRRLFKKSYLYKKCTCCIGNSYSYLNGINSWVATRKGAASFMVTCETLWWRFFLILMTSIVIVTSSVEYLCFIFCSMQHIFAGWHHVWCVHLKKLGS